MNIHRKPLKYSMKKKGKVTSTASCSYTTSVEEESENKEEIWVCGECNPEWEMDDNRWIVCDNCDNTVSSLMFRGFLQ